MSRRTRSGSSSHHQEEKHPINYGITDESWKPHMEGVGSEVTVGDTDNADDSESGEVALAGFGVEIDGQQYMRPGVSESAIISKCSVKSMSSLQIIQRLLAITPDDPDVLTGIPQGQMRNICFIVGIPAASHWKRLLADGLGAWKASKGPTNLFVRKEIDPDTQEVVSVAISQEEYSAEQNSSRVFFFQRRAYINASCQQYHRSVVTSADQRCGYAYSQYYFRDSIAHEFEVTIPGKSGKKPGLGYISTSSGRKRRQYADPLPAESPPPSHPPKIFYSRITTRGVSASPEKPILSEEFEEKAVAGTTATVTPPVAMGMSGGGDLKPPPTSSTFFGQFVASTLDGPSFNERKRLEAQREIMEVLLRKASEPTAALDKET